MVDKLADIYKYRKSEYAKDPQEENFLSVFNGWLKEREVTGYRQVPEEHPFIYTFGLPRSGTTLMSQLIAYSFNIGYINNFMARFWLAPVTGIKLSQAILKKEKVSGFNSHYAATSGLADIHEFGYFWAHWLKKENFTDIVGTEKMEDEIDWQGLKTVLLNIQAVFGKGFSCKNVLAAYHMKKFSDLFDKVLFVYIERDPLDSAISILDARKKYYQDLNKWWSYCPLEYDLIKNLPYMEQIGGQVFFLSRYYRKHIQIVPSKNVLRFKYEELCHSPLGIVQKIQKFCQDFFGYQLNISHTPPEYFKFRQYLDRDPEKRQFKTILEKMEREYGKTE